MTDVPTGRPPDSDGVPDAANRRSTDPDGNSPDPNDRREAASVAAVQRAAIDRALVDPGTARRSLALAGALDDVTDDGSGAAAPAPVTTALVAVAAVAGLRSLPERASEPPTLSPGPAGDGVADADPDPDRLVAAGAAVAARRPDVTIDDAAALAALPADRIREARAEPDDRTGAADCDGW